MHFNISSHIKEFYDLIIRLRFFILKYLSPSSFVKKDYGDTNFITGIRAYAAIGVVLIHSGGAGLRDLGVLGNHIVDIGRTGPYVFFVISGFAVAQSIKLSDSFKSYFLKRFFRIAPLYYFWLVVTIIMSISYFKNPNIDISVFNLITHLFFINFWDNTSKTSIIGVEWTIPIEMFYYIILPMMMSISRRGGLLLLLFISWIICNLSMQYAYLLPLPTEQAQLAVHFSPFPYGFCFVLGLLAFRVRPIVGSSSFQGNVAFLCASLACLIYMVFPGTILIFFDNEVVFFSMLTFVIIVYGNNKSFFYNFLFNNKSVQFLGVISYGIYLSHLQVMYFVNKINHGFFNTSTGNFIITLILTSIISALTYKLIEKPCIETGKFFARS
jgi:peptidoglycan/LPS O-acetylase OafA/YrhL